MQKYYVCAVDNGKYIIKKGKINSKEYKILGKFKNKVEAIKFIKSIENNNLINLDSVKLNKDIDKRIISLREDEAVIFTDGSYDISYKFKTECYSYGIVIFTKERNIGNPIKLNGKLLKPKHLNLRNIYSELKALMIALNYTVKKFPKIKKIYIYHDYIGISKWALKEWRIKRKFIYDYCRYIEKVKKRCELKFIHINSHTSIKYNDLADELCSKVIKKDKGESKDVNRIKTKNN